MVVVWSKPAQDDLKKYIESSKLVTEGKAKKYIERLIDYASSLEKTIYKKLCKLEILPIDN